MPAINPHLLPCKEGKGQLHLGYPRLPFVAGTEVLRSSQAQDPAHSEPGPHGAALTRGPWQQAEGFPMP